MSNIRRVGIVAGEASGDILGADLIRELKLRHPDCIFEGVGGSKMIEEGFSSLFPMDVLSVMGIVEPLKRLPQLLSIRSQLKKHFIQNPPDVFIGIDSPDFTIPLERKLKEKNITTVHYVSPSVWAWRKGRIKNIAKSVDLMLTLFPFEKKIYDENNIDCVCVGHPLADQIPLELDIDSAKEKLTVYKEYHPDKTTVAILPGSRKSELDKLADVFLQGAKLCADKMPDMQFLIPAANRERYAELQNYMVSYSDLNIVLTDGQSHTVMAAADAVLMASGTTTLEALLLKKPMVIAYRLANFSYKILSRMVDIEFIGLPNLLAGRKLVPELIQDEVTAENIAQSIMAMLRESQTEDGLLTEYQRIHIELKKQAGATAVKAIESRLAEINDK
ncbi:lipid-A-disaccharide synthase [Teredinibacter sp. KSP-S5-2]|uniref:lipid-A-disaccharide synthase n=1 Tax=Teredinibacter sp. KSP-S5-2 TaxID=3034506 RepID=UPI0029345895|nr:lipid-A-disaccharide synthase [Teredinibacter sp. KSP-S5-2]WNO09836.1 lipid-A-disaccharide synthase [Teredinibacter sp. KSP-S5-2]